MYFCDSLKDANDETVFVKIKQDFQSVRYQFPDPSEQNSEGFSFFRDN